MTERLRSTSTAGYQFSNIKMENDLSPRKTMFVLVIVVGCFAVLWPKVFYPMLMGSVNQHIKPSPIDKTTGCCDVISEIDVNTIKIMNELCGTIIKTKDDEKPLSGKEIIQRCRQEILETCGIDISAVLQEQVRLGQNTKQILNEIRSLNGSLCLKYHFGVAPWRLGVPHRINVKLSNNNNDNIRQERPLHLRSELIHPAFRERGRAIPQPHGSAQPRPPSRIIDGRPGPVPGMRPTIGGAGHVVPPSKQGTSSMSVIMPIYTIGIVIFFTYTLMKIIFKKQPETVGNGLYPPIDPDPHFRKEVFESEKSRLQPRLSRESISNKLGDAELDQLRQRLRETELAMERIVEQMAKVPLKSQELANGTLSNGDARKLHDIEEQPTVKVLGMETTASCEGGKRWSRPDSPVLPSSPPQPQEPATPPQEIFLEGALPAQSHLLVSESATEPQPNTGEDPAVVLAGKMTLSVISLDSSDNGGDILSDEAVITEEAHQEAFELVEALDKEELQAEPTECEQEPDFVQREIEQIVQENIAEETKTPEKTIEVEQKSDEEKVEVSGNLASEFVTELNQKIDEEQLQQNIVDQVQLEHSANLAVDKLEETLQKANLDIKSEELVTDIIEPKQEEKPEQKSEESEKIESKDDTSVEMKSLDQTETESNKVEDDKLTFSTISFSELVTPIKDEVEIEDVKQEVEELIDEAVQHVKLLQEVEESKNDSGEEEVLGSEEEIEEIIYTSNEEEEDSGDEQNVDQDKSNDLTKLNGEIGTEESKLTTTSNTAAEQEVSGGTDEEVEEDEEEIVEEVVDEEEEEVEDEEEEEIEIEVEVDEDEEIEQELDNNRVNNISGESEED